MSSSMKRLLSTSGSHPGTRAVESRMSVHAYSNSSFWHARVKRGRSKVSVRLLSCASASAATWSGTGPRPAETAQPRERPAHGLGGGLVSRAERADERPRELVRRAVDPSADLAALDRWTELDKRVWALIRPQSTNPRHRPAPRRPGS